MLVRILRHLVSIAVLPFVVITVVPRWLALHYGITFVLPSGVIDTSLVALGVLSFLGGALLAGSSVLMFFLHGDGTLAPWDPPKHFVAVGPYRYVRNPMISGVFFVLLAQTLVLRSPVHAAWTTFFALLNVTFIPLVEEPQLRARFGAPFEEYCRHVHRFVPRMTPYRMERRA